MSIEAFQEVLKSIASADPDVNIAAVKANQYTEMYKAGQITQGELAELLEDIQRQAAIDADMGDLESMEKLHTAITGLVEIAKLA
jgi:hypothetical protein